MRKGFEFLDNVRDDDAGPTASKQVEGDPTTKFEAPAGDLHRLAQRDDGRLDLRDGNYTSAVAARVAEAATGCIEQKNVALVQPLRLVPAVPLKRHAFLS